jgi:hypothetical protein
MPTAQPEIPDEGCTKFPIHRDLVKFDWDETPLSQQQIVQLSTAAFMDDAHNLILVGGTGTSTGKTHVAHWALPLFITANAYDSTTLWIWSTCWSKKNS